MSKGYRSACSPPFYNSVDKGRCCVTSGCQQGAVCETHCFLINLNLTDDAETVISKPKIKTNLTGNTKACQA